MFQADMSDNAKAKIAKIIEQENITDTKISITNVSDKGNNYMGVLQRITVKGIKNSKDVTKKIICKSIPSIQAVRELYPIVKYFRREIHAYNECSPVFESLQNRYKITDEDKFHFVKCYEADADEFHEIIFLEDLCDKGFEAFDRKKMLDMEHIRLIIDDIAKLHALSFALKDDNPNVFNNLVENVKKDYAVHEPVKNFIIASKDQVLDIITDELCHEIFYNYSENFFDKFFLSIDPERTEPYNVICHGDCWINNFLFKYENKKATELRFVDWQMVKYNSPVVDILHLIFTSMDQEFRRHHYDEIFDMYYRSLGNQLKKFNCDIEECYPEKIFKGHQIMMLPYALTVAVMSLPLLLCQNDEVIDMEIIAQSGVYYEKDFLKNARSTNALKERMEGIIQDLIKLNFFISHNKNACLELA